MKTEKRVFAYPIEMKGTKEELIAEAEALGLVWSVEGFVEQFNKGMIGGYFYQYDTYEVEVFDQNISYFLAGSKLVEDYLEGDYMSAVKNIEDGTGALIEYDHSEPLMELLNNVDGWNNVIDITPEEAQAIKSHLKE